MQEQEHDQDLVDRIAAAVVDLVRERGGGVSFVEIERRLDELGIPHEGDWMVGIGELTNRNICLWRGSLELSMAVQELADENREHRVDILPTSVLVYLVDGELPGLPIAKQLNRAYKQPRWLPVCFNLPGQR